MSLGDKRARVRITVRGAMTGEITRRTYKYHYKEKDVREFIKELNISYDEFKSLWEEFKKRPLALPQDWDQMKGIRRDFAMFRFILNRHKNKLAGEKLSK